MDQNNNADDLLDENPKEKEVYNSEQIPDQEPEVLVAEGTGAIDNPDNTKNNADKSNGIFNRFKLLIINKNIPLVIAVFIILLFSSLAFLLINRYSSYSTKLEQAASVYPAESCNGSVYSQACPPPIIVIPTPTNSEEFLPTYKTIPINENIIWLATPEIISSIPVFKDLSKYLSGPENSYKKSIQYYLMGNVAGRSNDQIIYIHFNEGMGSGEYFVRMTDNNYVIYKEHSSIGFYYEEETKKLRYTGPALNDDIVVDKETIIEDISPPVKIVYNNQSFATHSPVWYGNFFTTTLPQSNETTSYSKITELPQGQLYETTSNKYSNEVYKLSHMILVLKDHRSVDYNVDTELTNYDKSSSINWNNGTTTSSKDYAWGFGGCGAGINNEIALNISEDDLEIMGTTDIGNKVYIVKNTSNPLFTKHYNEYKQASSFEGSNLEKNISEENFRTKPGFFLYRDNLQRWLVFSNYKYITPSGCAKPVVYLYPNKPTFVNVAVGAQVTKSDPIYPSDGWKNVFAMPNGSLIYNQKGYNSLFWEGYGRGIYPEVHTGKIVKRTDTIKQIKGDLYDQGLNDKEVTDFMAFWANKIPNNPYVRITWLNTNQMQQLAPLKISPWPQTMIRVFLDMEGVNESYDLSPQTLRAFKRNGFTVVEWGGLSIDGSVPKLK
ncbi:MAG: hypothetical protein WCP03_04190 [Candidatus Saccharibacteria bacterium]